MDTACGMGDPSHDKYISGWKTSDQAKCKDACIKDAACRAVTVFPWKNKNNKGWCSLWSTECKSPGKAGAISIRLKRPCNAGFVLNEKKTACVGEWNSAFDRLCGFLFTWYEHPYLSHRAMKETDMGLVLPPAVRFMIVFRIMLKS